MKTWLKVVGGRRAIVLVNSILSRMQWSDWECSAVFVLHTHICKESMNIGNNLFIWTSYILKEVMEMNSSRMHAEAKIYDQKI